MRLNIFLLIFISSSVFARTPDELCREHINFDDLFVAWKNEHSSTTRLEIDKKEIMEQHSKSFLWSMEKYFSCREDYENSCKQIGIVEIKVDKDILDCSAF